MRTTGRVTALATAFLLFAASSALDADDGADLLDRTVVVTGENLFVLYAPGPAGWALVELPGLDLALPEAPRDPPTYLPPAAPYAPSPPQVLALMEVPDA